jgi:nitronate monooxygenase
VPSVYGLHISDMNLLERLKIAIPLIQAPMAGVSTPELAASVSNAGGLGSIAVGAVDAQEARRMIAEVSARTNAAFNVNVFVHSPPQRDDAREAAWLTALAPLFSKFDADPPHELRAIYKSFSEDEAMLRTLVESAPAVVSFHFGLPSAEAIAALKRVGSVLLATATNLAEAQAARIAGIDAVVAQGYEAGGHRGAFDPDVTDDHLSTLALTRMLVERARLPVIAAGAIMDGQGVRAVLELGAIAAQLGTAFIACKESSADPAYRAALFSAASNHTVMTRAISGRPARCLNNRFTAWERSCLVPAPQYPIAYDAGKALHAAARSKGEFGFGAQWAGQGAPLARALPAARLIEVIVKEMDRSQDPR